MAIPRVFISSTCYDLAEVRDSLVEFIRSVGFECVLSEAGDVFYHPDLHTHESCLNEVANCQLFLLVIGGRFGGSYVTNPEQSIVNAEYSAALEEKIPVFTFVKRTVYSDHHVFQKNKQSNALSQIAFPSIEKQDYAIKIFEFIDEVRLADVNNGYFAFDYAREIVEMLRKQWAGMFFEFLEQRSSGNRFATATTLLKNISMAGDKVEELVKSLYRHIDQATADTQIATVESRSAVKSFFFEMPDKVIAGLKSNHTDAIFEPSKFEKWEEYIAASYAGQVELSEDVDDESWDTVRNLTMNGIVWRIFEEDSKKMLEQYSLRQQLFQALSSLDSEQFAGILNELEIAKDNKTEQSNA